jgi:hypothetical protein
VWSSVGAGLPIAVTYLAAAVTVGLSLLAVHGMLRLAEHWGPGPASPGAATPVPAQASPTSGTGGPSRSSASVMR